jgi:radical SAM superfamily enzyme YgiQ (UPF0313 family)
MIVSVLKDRNYDVGLLVLTPDSDMHGTLGRYIQEFRPSLFCLTAVSSQFGFICKIARAIKDIDPSIYIIVGGHHATLNPEQAISSPYIDSICIGEGEAAVVELAAKLEKKEPVTNINNLWVKNKSTNEIEKNGTNLFIQDLDTLPLIDRDIWRPWIHDNNRMLSVLLGRGCPYRCAYCSNHVLSKVAEGRYVRFRSPENIIEELKAILDVNPSIEDVYLEAETLGANIKFAYELLDRLDEFNRSRAKKVRFGCNFALSKAIIGNETLLAKLKDANFSFINIGLESGSGRVRNEIHRPKYSNADLIDYCGLARKYGIQIYLFVLIGLPGETLLDFRETIQCVRECAPENVYLSIFYPYPGTQLYNTAKEMNLFDSYIIDENFERRKAQLDLPGFSRSQIQRQYYFFYYHAFKGIWPASRIILHVLRTYIGAHGRLEKLYKKVVGLKVMRLLQRRISSTSK